MSKEITPLSFGQRFFLAFSAFFKILFDGLFAAKVVKANALPEAPKPDPKHAQLEATEKELAGERAKREDAEKQLAQSRKDAEASLNASQEARKSLQEAQDKLVEAQKSPAGALRILSLLQRDGRFIDFLQDDVTSYSDQDVGAAARVVHSGCKKALQAYLKLEPVMSQQEGEKISVEKGFDPGKIRLTGNVVGEPPFKGQLVHRGWKASEFKLPEIPAGQDPNILAPAEVEL
jgi:hypothetical protein